MWSVAGARLSTNKAVKISTNKAVKIRALTGPYALGWHSTAAMLTRTDRLQ
jgi:hypothetical protein